MSLPVLANVEVDIIDARICDSFTFEYSGVVTVEDISISTTRLLVGGTVPQDNPEVSSDKFKFILNETMSVTVTVKKGIFMTFIVLVSYCKEGHIQDIYRPGTLL